MACMARSGFLTLRDCGNPEAQNCTSCGRPMCAQHLTSRSGFSECYECGGANQDLDPTDPEWSYGYRRNFYASNGYAPLYFGSREFDDYDVRSFHGAANRAGIVDDDAQGAAGFGDS